MGASLVVGGVRVRLAPLGEVFVVIDTSKQFRTGHVIVARRQAQFETGFYLECRTQHHPATA